MRWEDVKVGDYVLHELTKDVSICRIDEADDEFITLVDIWENGEFRYAGAHQYSLEFLRKFKIIKIYNKFPEEFMI